MKIICRTFGEHDYCCGLEYAVLEISEDFVAMVRKAMAATRALDLPASFRCLSIAWPFEVYSYDQLFAAESEQLESLEQELYDGDWIAVPDWLTLPDEPMDSDWENLCFRSYGKEDGAETIGLEFTASNTSHAFDTPWLSIAQIEEFLGATVSP